MRGRPTKFDPELAKRVIDLIRVGNFVETAAAACGVHRATLYRWLERGDRQREGVLRDFSDAVAKAQAESESRDLLLIAKAALSDWRAAAWRLERRWPRRFGPQVHVSVRQEIEDMLAHCKKRLEAPAFEAVLVAIADGEETDREEQ